MGPQDFLLLDEVCDNSIRDAPTNEVQLGYSCGDALKFNALRAAERIEELLRVAVERRLVSHMYSEYLAVRRRVCDVTGLGVVGHKPLQVSK
jgi:hypothetical protein